MKDSSDFLKILLIDMHSSSGFQLLHKLEKAGFRVDVFQPASEKEEDQFISRLLESSEIRDSEPLQVRDLFLDPRSRVVVREGHQIKLQSHEFDLLEYFMQNAGKILTKAQILRRIWNYQFDPQTNIVEVLVSRLRAKVDRGFAMRLIENVRGVGYLLRA